MGFFINGGFGMIFFLLFALVIGVFILTAIRGISQWNKNNHSPRLEVEATVVAKREEVTHCLLYTSSVEFFVNGCRPSPFTELYTTCCFWLAYGHFLHNKKPPIGGFLS